jgi:hypothetical protein
MEDESPFSIAIAKTEGYADKKGKNNLGQFKRDPNFHIYGSLYEMKYPVRFLRLYKKYGLKDEKYEQDHLKKWFEKDYKECTDTLIYGGRCIYIRDNNITLNEYDIYKFFEIIGYQNRQKTKKRSK